MMYFIYTAIIKIIRKSVEGLFEIFFLILNLKYNEI